MHAVLVFPSSLIVIIEQKQWRTFKFSLKNVGEMPGGKQETKVFFFLCFFAHDFFSYVFRFCSFRFISALWILCVDKCCCMIRSGNEVLVDIYYSSLRRLRGPKGWRRIIHRKEPNARKPMGGFTKIGSFNCILVPFDLVCDTV